MTPTPWCTAPHSGGSAPVDRAHPQTARADGPQTHRPLGRNGEGRTTAPCPREAPAPRPDPPACPRSGTATASRCGTAAAAGRSGCRRGCSFPRGMRASAWPLCAGSRSTSRRTASLCRPPGGRAAQSWGGRGRGPAPCRGGLRGLTGPPLHLNVPEGRWTNAGARAGRPVELTQRGLPARAPRETYASGFRQVPWGRPRCRPRPR